MERSRRQGRYQANRAALGDARRVRRFLHWLVRLRGSAHAIARGVAIGMIVAFTPTIGFQTVLALGLATLLNASRPVSIVPTWFTNPVTIPPIYAFTYYLGSFLWPGSEVTAIAAALREAAVELASHDFWAMRRQLGVFVDLGLDVFMPMMIGGLLVGGLAAAVSYPLTLRAVVKLRERRSRGRQPEGKPRRASRAPVAGNHG